MFTNFIHSQLLELICLSPNCCEAQISKNYQTSKYTFYRSVLSTFAVQLFLLPFSSHCSMQNISFTDSGYVIKPPLFTELCLLQGTLAHRLIYWQLSLWPQPGTSAGGSTVAPWGHLTYQQVCFLGSSKKG